MSKVDERFDAKVNAAPGLGPWGTCHEWTASTRGRPGGPFYGAFGVAGRTLGAHVFAYERAYGPVPAGLVLHHRCVNPLCVNPAHLDATPQATHEDAAPTVKRSMTHCARDHAFDAQNTYRRVDRPTGGRVCRICKRDHARARRARTGGP